jgi:hypothetical protein
VVCNVARAVAVGLRARWFAGSFLWRDRLVWGLAGRYGVGVLITTDTVSVDAFAAGTGWVAKPEGLCKGEMCVPAPGSLTVDGLVDVAVATAKLSMPVVKDEVSGVQAIGRSTLSAKALDSVALPAITLETRDGNPFNLSALHGRQTLLVAWASW